MSAKVKVATKEGNDESMNGNVSLEDKPKFNIVADLKQEGRKPRQRSRVGLGREVRTKSSMVGFPLSPPLFEWSGLRPGWDPMGGGTDVFVKCRRFLEPLAMRAGSKSFDGNCFAERKLSKDGMIAVRPCPFHCILECAVMPIIKDGH